MRLDCHPYGILEKKTWVSVSTFIPRIAKGAHSWAENSRFHTTIGVLDHTGSVSFMLSIPFSSIIPLVITQSLLLLSTSGEVWIYVFWCHTSPFPSNCGVLELVDVLHPPTYIPAPSVTLSFVLCILSPILVAFWKGIINQSISYSIFNHRLDI